MGISLTKKQIDNALALIAVGLEKYLWLQEEFYKTDVSKDVLFQKKFNGFYRIRRNKEWQKHFYRLLENNKRNKPNFAIILNTLEKKTGRVEASFASKLVATADTRLPVIDKVVFENMGLKLPSKGKVDRQKVIAKQYQIMKKEFSDFLKTETGNYLMQAFKKKYPNAKISKTKMLDLVLWQTRG